jgi:hypothetical protein
MAAAAVAHRRNDILDQEGEIEPEMVRITRDIF